MKDTKTDRHATHSSLIERLGAHEGFTLPMIAAATGMSGRTVRRYWKASHRVPPADMFAARLDLWRYYHREGNLGEHLEPPAVSLQLKQSIIDVLTERVIADVRSAMNPVFDAMIRPVIERGDVYAHVFGARRARLLPVMEQLFIGALVNDDDPPLTPRHAAGEVLASIQRTYAVDLAKYGRGEGELCVQTPAAVRQCITDCIVNDCGVGLWWAQWVDTRECLRPGCEPAMTPARKRALVKQEKHFRVLLQNGMKDRPSIAAYLAQRGTNLAEMEMALKLCEETIARLTAEREQLLKEQFASL